jgi:hypothetical protein
MLNYVAESGWKPLVKLESRMFCEIWKIKKTIEKLTKAQKVSNDVAYDKKFNQNPPNRNMKK